MSPNAPTNAANHRQVHEQVQAEIHARPRAVNIAPDPQPVPKPKTNPSDEHQAAETNPSAPALPFELSALPDEVLAALADAAPRELARRRAEREEAFLKEIREQTQALGIAPARLAAAIAGKSARNRASANASADGRSRVRAKYRDLKSDRTWSGRGNAPSWFAEHVAGGGTEEDMKIPEGAV